MYKQVISSMFNGIFEKKDKLLKALLLPTILLLVLEQLVPSSIQEGESSFSLVVSGILLFIINIVIAIIVHRVLLSDDDTISKNWGLYKFTGREFKFLFSSIGIGILAFLPALVAMFPLMFFGSYIEEKFSSDILSIIIAVLMFSVIAVIFSRLSLVLPSIAIDKDMGFSDAWKFTSNYKMLTFLCVVFIPAVVAVIISAIYGLAIGFLVTVISDELVFLNTLLNLFVNVFVISALSATYKHLIPEDFDEKENKEKLEQSTEITTFEKDGVSRIFVPFSLEHSFDHMKQLVQEQYFQLGFSNVVIDKEDSWMIKTSSEGQAYVGISVLNENYKVEAYNTKKPDLELFKYKDEEL